MSASGIFDKPPFNGRLVFDENGLFSFLSEDTTCVSKEGDYLPFGKRLFEKVGGGYPVVFSKNASLGEILKGLEGEEKNVFAVGGGEFIEACRYAAYKYGFSLVVAPTDLLFYKVFAKKSAFFVDGRSLSLALPLPDKVFIDVKGLSVLKKKDLADGYAAVAAKASSVEAQLALPEAKSLLAGAEGLVLSASAFPFPSLVKANLLLAAATYLDGNVGVTEVDYAGKLLSFSTGFSVEECSLFIAEYVLGAYSVFIENDLTGVGFFPDYLSALSAAALFFGVEGTALLNSFESPDYAQAYKIYAQTKAKYTPALIGECKKKLSRLKRAYALVYAGRKKRATASREQALEALELSGVYSEGLLNAVFGLCGSEPFKEAKKSLDEKE